MIVTASPKAPIAKASSHGAPMPRIGLARRLTSASPGWLGLVDGVVGTATASDVLSEVLGGPAAEVTAPAVELAPLPLPLPRFGRGAATLPPAGGVVAAGALVVVAGGVVAGLVGGVVVDVDLVAVGVGVTDAVGVGDPPGRDSSMALVEGLVGVFDGLALVGGTVTDDVSVGEPVVVAESVAVLVAVPELLLEDELELLAELEVLAEVEAPELPPAELLPAPELVEPDPLDVPDPVTLGLGEDVWLRDGS